MSLSAVPSAAWLKFCATVLPAWRSPMKTRKMRPSPPLLLHVQRRTSLHLESRVRRRPLLLSPRCRLEPHRWTCRRSERLLRGSTLSTPLLPSSVDVSQSPPHTRLLNHFPSKFLVPTREGALKAPAANHDQSRFAYICMRKAQSRASEKIELKIACMWKASENASESKCSLTAPLRSSFWPPPPSTRA